MKTYKFYKTVSISTGKTKWFIDIPRFPFNKSWLEMVAGADLLLDALSNDKNEVNISIDTRPFPYTDGWLNISEKLGIMKGAIYNVNSEKYSIDTTEFFRVKNLLWLCPVTLWVFWKYPKKIYFKISK